MRFVDQAQPEKVVTFQQALVLFEMTEVDLLAPGSQNRLDQKRRQLLLTWYPPRYATLTNNPKKYMKMYKQGEAMTKEIQTAYEVLITTLENRAHGKQSDVT